MFFFSARVLDQNRTSRKEKKATWRSETASDRPRDLRATAAITAEHAGGHTRTRREREGKPAKQKQAHKSSTFPVNRASSFLPPSRCLRWPHHEQRRPICFFFCRLPLHFLGLLVALFVSVHLYIYVCVCACVCRCVLASRPFPLSPQLPAFVRATLFLRALWPHPSRSRRFFSPAPSLHSSRSRSCALDISNLFLLCAVANPLLCRTCRVTRALNA